MDVPYDAMIYEAERVRALCEEIGYGFTIGFAAAMWAIKSNGNAGMAAWLRSLAESIEQDATVEQRWVEVMNERNDRKVRGRQ